MTGGEREAKFIIGIKKKKNSCAFEIKTSCRNFQEIQEFCRNENVYRNLHYKHFLFIAQKCAALFGEMGGGITKDQSMKKMSKSILMMYHIMGLKK